MKPVAFNVREGLPEDFPNTDDPVVLDHSYFHPLEGRMVHERIACRTRDARDVNSVQGIIVLRLWQEKLIDEGHLPSGAKLTELSYTGDVNEPESLVYDAKYEQRVDPDHMPPFEVDITI